MKYKFTLLLITFVTTFLGSVAQNNTNTQLEILIEEIAESTDQDIDFTDIAENLHFYFENKINLNTASRADFEKLFFLNDFQIDEILKYRYKANFFNSIYELQLLETIDNETINKLLPFVQVLPYSKIQIPELKNILKYGNQTIFLRTQFTVQQQSGYEPDYTNGFLGNKYQFYTKYKFNYKNRVTFGFTTEKDPGEQFFKNNQKYGFDYYSAFASINDFGIFKSINIGDYRVGFGQGLVVWKGYPSGKSSLVNEIRKNTQGFSNYSSTDENKFMRGIATQIQLKNLSLAAFFSYKNIDANISQPDTALELDYIATSFQTTGYHRTISENTDRKTVSELITGSNLKYAFKNLNVSGTFLFYSFGTPVLKENEPYNYFIFSGKQNFNLSIDYNFSHRNFFFFGEEAMSQNGAIATINGISANPAPQISMSVLHRNYAENYQAYYSAAFAETSATVNEKGTYLAVEINPYKSLSVSAYIDTYVFPWLRYSADSPSNGADYFIQTSFSTSRYINMYARYKYEKVFKNKTDIESGIAPTVPFVKKQFRYNIDYEVSKTLSLKNRIEISNYNETGKPAEKGFLIFEDISYNPEKIPINFDFRIAMFDATYNARIYTYENDILYGYSVPALSGKGIRTYLTLKFTPVKNFIDIWLRYALFSYTQTNTISSGLTEIEGNNKSDIKFQIRIKL